MPMLLQGEDGTEFELALIADAVPRLQNDEGDSKPITVSFRAATPDESWEESSPCVNTFEIENLAAWLHAVERGEPEEAEMDLLVPELHFEVLRSQGDKLTLRVGFHIDDRPPQLEVDAQTDEADHIDLEVSRLQLRAAAAQLKQDIADVGRPDLNELAIAPDDLDEVPEDAEGFVQLVDNEDEKDEEDLSDDTAADFGDR